MELLRPRHPVWLAVIVLVVAACSGATEQSAGWTFGPELSQDASGAASGAPSGSAAASAPAPSGSEEPSGSPAASASAAPSGAGGGAPTLADDSLALDVVVEGLTEPTGIAVVSADEQFVIEKSTGRVFHVQGGQAGDPVLDLAVNFFDERGLLGIALHPSFADNGYVYLFWTASGQGEGDEGRLGPDTDEETALPELGNRVDRFVWDGSALTFDRPIIAMRSNTLDTDTSGRIRGNHDAGPLVFGPDGRLFIVMGDQNLRGQFQNLPDGPPPDDPNFTGMVVRLEDDGSTPEDNPFVAAGEALGGEVGENVAKTWAYGVRNSFGLAIHPDTGALWQTENGDDSWDEVNILPAGANSGWIQLIGPPERFEEYKEIEVGSEDGLDNPDFPPDQLAESSEEAQSRMFQLEGSTYVAPVFSWKFPIAVTSIAFVTGDALGESSAGTAWMGNVLTDSLYRYPLAADGSGFDFGDDQALADKVDDNTAKGDLGESADYVVGSGFGVVTHIVTGPDDRLYVVSLTGGAVYRIGPAEGGGGGGGAGGGGTAPSPTPGESPAVQTPLPGETTALTIGTDTGAQLLFDPTEVTVPAGASVTVTFENRSTVPHNLTFGPPIRAATNTVVAPGASETIQFTAPEPGEYEYVCTLHPGMTGVLRVTGA